MALSFYRGKLGGGGYLMDVIWSPDGLTGLIRPDVYGPWIWEPTLGVAGEWRPLVTATSMPAAATKLGNDGISQSCYAIDVARSNSNIIYMVSPSTYGDSTVYKSTDRGVTFTATTMVDANMSIFDSGKVYGRKMMIHPTDPDIVIVTNSIGEAYRTANGGTSWTQISGLPTGTDALLTFDYSNGNICYMGWRTGNNRLWKSTDAGVTFSQMTGGPDNFRRIHSAVNGKIYMTHEGLPADAGIDQNSWRLVGTTFTNLSPNFNGDGGYHDITTSPVNPDRVTLVYTSGTINTSLDGGDTWGGMYAATAFRESSDDIQWLEWTNEDSMSSGNIVYDPLIEDKLWFAEGIGLWYCTPPTGATKPTWYSMTRGQEELIINSAIWPPGKRPWVGTQDRGVFKLDSFTTYPSTHGPGRTAQLQHSYGMDYASSDPNYIAVANNNGPGKYYSADDGATYSAFASQGSGAYGHFAALSPSKILYQPSNNGFVQYSLDGGASWTLSTFPGDVPTSGESGYGYTYFLNLKYICADRVNGKYYAYNYKTGDMYVSVDDGANFTKTADGVRQIGIIGENQELVAVPGQAGHLFMTSGFTNPLVLKRTKNGDSASATWSSVANTSAAWAIGFSAPAPGQSYPAILLAGKCNGDTEFGIYLSVDDCVTWELQTRNPGNETDQVRAIAGNPDTYGEFILGGAAGYFYTNVGVVAGKSFGLQF